MRLLWAILGVLTLLTGLTDSVRGQSPGSPSTVPPPADAVISPGDVIAITVVGEKDLSRRVTVTEDGKVPMAYVGEIEVAGMRPMEAAAHIREALSRYLRNPEVTVDLVEANRASVFGRVLRPGTYVLPPLARAMDLVQIAGGFEENADRTTIRLLRKSTTIPVDLAKYAATGDPHWNPELRAGDVINVPERPAITITIMGQVMRPGTLSVPLDATVMDAVQMAGGFCERANRERVTLGRGGIQIPVNLERFEMARSPSDNPKLQAGDNVTVPGKRLLTITVLGQVLKPSVYQVPEGTTIAEAIVLAGGIVDGSDLTLARVIHRDLREEPVNLRDALENANAVANIALRDGDTVSLPKPAIERRFGVLGAVRAGGYFLMDRDRVTVLEALARAGGPVEDADLRHAVIVRRSGSQTMRTPIDLMRFLKGDKSAEMVTLGPGDILYVEDKGDSFFSRSNILAVVGVLTSLLYALGR